MNVKKYFWGGRWHVAHKGGLEAPSQANSTSVISILVHFFNGSENLGGGGVKSYKG